MLDFVPGEMLFSNEPTFDMRLNAENGSRALARIRREYTRAVVRIRLACRWDMTASGSRSGFSQSSFCKSGLISLVSDGGELPDDQVLHEAGVRDRVTAIAAGEDVASSPEQAAIGADLNLIRLDSR